MPATTPTLSAARFVALVGAFTVGASMLSVWGPDAAVGTGPPETWQRSVVGAMLLCFLGLFALFVAGKKTGGASFSVALGGAAVAISVNLYLKTQSSVFAHLTEGRGWTFMMIGSALTCAAGLGALAGVLLQKKPRKRRR